MRWLHHPFYVFVDADYESDIENLEVEKFDRTGHLKFWNYNGDQKIKKNQNFLEKGVI